MPETPDPIHLLETFGTGGIVRSPLEPAQVRRLGNRRRARRRTSVVLVAATATAAVLVPLGLALGDRPDSSAPVDRTPAPSPSASPSHTTNPSPAEITYPGAGVVVRTAADTSRLTGTSRAFRTFIAGELNAISGGASCAEIHVQKYSSAGYATGAVGGCGGYAALWATSEANDGAWGEAQGTQDIWDCDSLAYLKIPTSFAGACADVAGDFATPGYGGPEPGMSKDQLTALGMIVNGPAAGADPTSCPGVDYRAAVLPDRVAGLWDPKDGLVDIAATTNMKTPERVGLGTPRAKAIAAYPQGHADQGGDYLVPRPAGTTLFLSFRRGMVAHMDWRLTPQHCSAWMP